VVARWRRDEDSAAQEADKAAPKAWPSEQTRAERAPKVSELRSFRTAVNSLREAAAPAHTVGYAGYTKFGGVGDGPAYRPTRGDHDSHEYANAVGSGLGKGASPAKGTAAKGKLNVVHPIEEEERPATAKTPAGKGDAQKGKQRSKDSKGSGKLVWKSKTDKPAAADADAPFEEQKRQEATPKGDASKANSSKDASDTAPAQDATKHSKKF